MIKFYTNIVYETLWKLIMLLPRKMKNTRYKIKWKIKVDPSSSSSSQITPLKL